jgi:CheY-like chemotaxis protein
MSERPKPRRLEILLVEDNPGDVVLVREALGDGPVNVGLSVAADGETALARLRRQGAFADAARPDLVLLDLNLPRQGGLEVLAAVKGDERLRRTPVVVFTSSEAERDVAAAYDLHANCYVIKSADLEQFLGVVKRVVEFWLTVARLPGEA